MASEEGWLREVLDEAVAEVWLWSDGLRGTSKPKLTRRQRTIVRKQIDAYLAAYSAPVTEEKA